MNHDLAHCTGQNIATRYGEQLFIECNKRDTCKRYKAYRNLKGDEEYPISFCSAVECIKENYNLFWKDKE